MIATSVIFLLFLVLLGCCFCFCLAAFCVALQACNLFTCLAGTCLFSLFHFNVHNSYDTHCYERTPDQNLSAARHSSSLTSDAVIAEAFLVSPLAAARLDTADDDVINSPETQVSRHESSFQDQWTAVVFFATVCATVWFAGKNFETNNGNGVDIALYAKAVGLSSILSVFICTIILATLVRVPSMVIEGILWFKIVLWLVCSIISFYARNSILACFLLFSSLLNYWYLRCARSRIAFASAILTVASTAIDENYAAISFASVGMQLLQFAWIVICAAAWKGLSSDIATTEPRLRNRGWIAITLLLFATYWGIQVIRNVLHATVAGTVGCWWFQPRRAAPVRGSLFRAVTASFGSICIGSLLVALVQTIRSIVALIKGRHERARNRRERFILLQEMLFCCVAQLLEWIDSAMVYFNKYVFCYVAAYGLGYIDSAKRVHELFKFSGWSALVSDNLIGNTLFFGVVPVTAVVTSISAVLLSGGVFVDGSSSRPAAFHASFVNSTEASYSHLLPFAIAGGVLGAAMGSMVAAAVDGGAAMVFVCFADNPIVLEVEHPFVHERLVAAWAKVSPTHLQPFGGGGGDVIGAPYTISESSWPGRAETPGGSFGFSSGRGHRPVAIATPVASLGRDAALGESGTELAPLHTSGGASSRGYDVYHTGSSNSSGSYSDGRAYGGHAVAAPAGPVGGGSTVTAVTGSSSDSHSKGYHSRSAPSTSPYQYRQEEGVPSNRLAEEYAPSAPPFSDL